MQDSVNFGKFVMAFDGRHGFSSQNIRNVARDTNEKVALKIINQFRISLETTIQQIDRILSSPTRDWESIQKVCHKLAGSSELVGFSDLGNNCRNVMNLPLADEQFEKHAQKIRSDSAKLLALIATACPELSTYV